MKIVAQDYRSFPYSYLIVLDFTLTSRTMFNVGSCRYAYSEETGDDFDEEAITLVGGGVKISGEMGTILERKERKASVTSLATDHHVFGLVGEDKEEDKRE